MTTLVYNKISLCSFISMNRHMHMLSKYLKCLHPINITLLLYYIAFWHVHVLSPMIILIFCSPKCWAYKMDKFLVKYQYTVNCLIKKCSFLPCTCTLYSVRSSYTKLTEAFYAYSYPDILFVFSLFFLWLKSE